MVDSSAVGCTTIPQGTPLERDQRLFVEGTRARVEQLISRQVWVGLDLPRCRSWFQQFAAGDCELLGACLLDHLTYRRKVQVEALLRSVLSSPEMIGDRAEHDFAPIDSLRDRWKDPGIRLSPVIRLDQSPTKSGTYMLRLLARSLRLQERWMVWPQALQKTPLGVHTAGKRRLKVRMSKRGARIRSTWSVIGGGTGRHCHWLPADSRTCPRKQDVAGTGQDVVIIGVA